ncbi:hypothetical protein BDV12DRAFT_203908 [Aspergillus spectabilis]
MPSAQYRQIDDPDFCEYLESRGNIMQYQLYFLNPQLNEDCSNVQIGGIKPLSPIQAYPGYRQPRFTPIDLLAQLLATLKRWTGISKPSSTALPLAPGTRKNIRSTTTTHSARSPAAGS